MPLSDTLLERFERCLHDQRVPWLEHRRPGLSEERMAELTDPAGIRLPPELRLWWGWFDGADGSHPPEMTPGFEAYRLGYAVDHRAMMRDIAVETAEVGGLPVAEYVETMYPTSFLSVFRSQQPVTLAADTALGPATPLHYVEYHPNLYPLLLLAPSLGDAIHRWVEMFEAGYYGWDRDAARWRWRHDRAVQPLITLL